MEKILTNFSYLNSDKKASLSLSIFSKSSTENKNKQKKKDPPRNKAKINLINFYYITSYFINLLLYDYILFSLPKKVYLISSPISFITLQVNNIGDQQIFSDRYNISQFYPFRIYVNNSLQILRNKKVFVESIEDEIKIEWAYTNNNMAYMFANLQNIKSITLNNMLNSTGNNNFSYMYYNCQNLEKFSYNGTKTNYKITDVSHMFNNCRSLFSVHFNGYYTASDINISYMFYNCTSLKEIYFAYNLNVGDMRYLFYNCYNLTSIDLSKFNPILNNLEGVNISFLFYNCYNLEYFQPTKKKLLVNDMRYMFYNCSHLNNIILNFFQINNSTNISYLFFNCQNLEKINWVIDEYNMSHPSDMRSMYFNCTNITKINLPFHSKNGNINMSRLFYNCLNLTNIEFIYGSSYYPTDMREMFYSCTSLKTLNIKSYIKTDYVEDMSLLFYNCISLSYLSFDFSNNLTTNMRGIFLNCTSLSTLDLSKFYTPKAEIMWEMFKGCSELQKLDLNKFDTSQVTDMESMFEGCTNLISLSLSHFNTSKVQYMNKMFKDCTSLTSINFKNINTDSLGTMHQMFYNCEKLEYLNLYSITEKGQSYLEMFTGTSNNFQFCIKENENIPNIFQVLLNITNSTRDCTKNCYGVKRIDIPEKKLCCPFFRYKDKCYNNCPRKTKVINKANICEDFNCTNEAQYYNFEQSDCTNNIKGFYVNDSISKTIDKCHEDCLECKGKWSNETSNCSVCSNEKPYIYLGNCYQNCTPGFYQGNINQCKCFNKKCELCSEKSLEYDLCETCNKDYYPKENDPKNIKSYKNCYHEPKNYFLENKIYKPCFSSCEFCTKKGDYDNQFCLSCNNDTSYAIQMEEPNNSTFNCYPNCTYYYYFDEEKQYQCTKDPVCPQEYSKLIYGDRRCVKSCLEHKRNKYEYQNVCYEECPPDRSFNLNKTDYFCKITCPFEKPFEMVKKQICVSNCTIMERKDKLCVTNYKGNRSNDEVQDKVLNNLRDDIIDTFDYNYVTHNISIVLEEIDHTYEIITTNNIEDNSKTSEILLGQCETILKDFYSIEKDEPLYLLKLDAYREGMINPKVIYIVYYPLNGFKLEQLDLTLCEGSGISLLFSANLTKDEDLYNKNSAYYNDVCYTFTSDDGTDISLQDRQQEYADNNMSLCEERCEFVKYHYDTEKAECSCEVKSNVPLLSETKIDKDALYNFVDIRKLVNFDVMKCYFLLLDTKNLVKNIGVYIYLPTFISYFICLILFLKLEYNLVKKNVNDIVNAKETMKYLVESGKFNDYLNGNIKVNYDFKHDDDPVNMIKMQNMKLSKRFKDRSIKNNQNNKTSKITIKRKIVLKRTIKNKKNKIGIKNDNNEEELNQENKEINNIILSKISVDMTKKYDNSNDIYEVKAEKNDNITDSKNAPPIKLKRPSEDDRSRQSKEINKMPELSVQQNLMETKANPKDSEEKTSKNLDTIVKHKENYSKEEIDNIRNILEYNDNELNSMDYKGALKYDKRGFLKYYFSLLKTKHLLITLIETRDYNSRIIKIYLVFFNFASCYAINTLFFDDDTMHSIYEEKGNYNFFAQLPQIIYSTLISYCYDTFMSFLALSEDDIISLKKEKEIENLGIKKSNVITNVHLKTILFFILSFLLLILFWYYTTCFCAVYKNTQYHLLKDTLISFATSMCTPFGVYLLPPIFRIIALRRKSKSRQFLYGLSKFIQFF